MLPPQIDAWREAANPPESHRGIPDHSRRRGSLAASTPTDRMTELLSEIHRLRGYLGDACHEFQKRADDLDAAEADRARFAADYYRWRHFASTSFGGVPMAQHWVDLTVWEAVLNDNPEMLGVVEIGTWQGGFSLWLAAQCQARGMRFHTCDSVAPDRPIPGFDRVDVWATPEIVDAWLLPEPVVLFCDGGNKPRELRTFGAMLKDPRSLVLVHDWGTETMPGDVPDFLVPEHADWFESLGSITRAFRLRT